MKLQQRQRGQGLVEFALLIPLFIFMIFIFIDLARITASYLELSNSVREATRYAMVHVFDVDQITNIVYDYSPSLDHSQMVVNPTKGLRDVTVVASYTYFPVTPVMAIFLGSDNSLTLNVQSSATLSPLYQ